MAGVSRTVPCSAFLPRRWVGATQRTRPSAVLPSASSRRQTGRANICLAVFQPGLATAKITITASVGAGGVRVHQVHRRAVRLLACPSAWLIAVQRRQHRSIKTPLVLAQAAGWSRIPVVSANGRKKTRATAGRMNGPGTPGGSAVIKEPPPPSSVDGPLRRRHGDGRETMVEAAVDPDP